LRTPKSVLYVQVEDTLACTKRLETCMPLLQYESTEAKGQITKGLRISKHIK